MNRRRRLLLATAAAAAAVPPWFGRAAAAERGAPLPIPPLVQVGSSGATLLEAIDGRQTLLPGLPAATRGFSQPFLGPVLRMVRGSTARIDVRNRLREATTVHWHGLHVPGSVDGGPHSEIAPGALWQPSLEIDQPATTAWYHAHPHGSTGPQVYSGLAGMILIDEPGPPDAALPRRYGVDDLPLIVQDRLFAADGRLRYSARGMAMMSGLRGDHILVNGALTPLAAVPAGIVRLRVLNACNARILRLRFEDSRAMHQIGSDGGLFDRPNRLRQLTLATGERAEVLVDFSDGRSVRLLSAPDSNSPMRGAGMRGGMGGGMGGMGMNPEPESVDSEGGFEVLRFAVEAEGAAAVQALPQRLAHAARPPNLGEPVRSRRFVLDSHGMMGGMMGGMGRGMPGGIGMMSMTINGRSFDMARIDHATRRGDTERWEVRAGDMAHPFHLHGASFQVLTLNGRPVEFATTGWKDTVLVDGSAELLVRFDHTAGERSPYMFHCHILEHEDAGMMGQFTVA
jgi:blue copper oxidase